MKKTQQFHRGFIKNTSLSFLGAQRTVCILIALAILFSGCASTTLFKTSPTSADIYINEQKVGITPYSHTDRKAAGASTSIFFQKEGYKDLYINLKRNEQLAVGALIAGIWLLVPLFWIKKYDPVHYYEMEKVGSDKQLISAIDSVQFRANELEMNLIEETVSKVDSTFTDSRDGNTYKIVKIGNQIWLAENLRYLPQVNIPSDVSRKEPRYYVNGSSWSNIDSAKQENNYKSYGVLYNWSAACKSCPDGWHLPSDNEWKELEMYLGMTQTEADIISTDYFVQQGPRGSDEGRKLKASYGWDNYERVIRKRGENIPKDQIKDTVTMSGNGTDDFGFKALPGGLLGFKGEFEPPGKGGIWWTSTPLEFHIAFSRDIYSGSSTIIRSHRTSRKDGISVRCLKNSE